MGELLSEVIGGQSVSRETLRRVAEASPYPSFALAAPTAVVLRRLADASIDHGERVGWLVDLSNRLADLGRREEALAAIEETGAIRRQLAKDHPDAFLPGLAASLDKLPGRLVDFGRREQTLAAIEQAVTIRR